ncbi:MAG TPA: class I SAM-dependent methyltransferase [Chitinophagales bacterium]|nr:class I SAM-dependent methyltransferase [Chitinophagales bacterium]
MDRKYWEEVALVHDDKIFDVFSHDTKRVIHKNILKYASKSKTAMDLGCAIGNWLPLLSPAFKKVYAVDIAKHYIDLAKEYNKHLKNIEYIHADLGKLKTKLTADMVVCINTLLTPKAKDRNAAYETVIKAVAKNGYLVLVVPALESALYSEHVLNYWNEKDKKAGKKVTKEKMKQGDPFAGVIHLDTTPTKHYLKEELHFMLQNSGFEIIETNKVEYTWETEFTNPPKWLKAPFPWDWLVVAKRLG